MRGTCCCLHLSQVAQPSVGLTTLQALLAANTPQKLARRGHPLLTLCLSCHVVCSEYSKTLNDARLKVLAARETAIQAVVKEARARVRDLARNPTAYKKLLQDLLVQVRP